MTELKAKIVLSDIEGTTTSISFVKDVLFPYAKQHSRNYLQKHWHEDFVKEMAEQLMNLLEYQQFLQQQKEAAGDTLEQVTSFVNYLIDLDVKVAPLKTLQGYVWSDGYDNGSLKGHIYHDVSAAFQHWHDAGLSIVIYSSGSVKAQKLLFGQTIAGNLLPLINGHFDTAIGHKQQSQSYANIAKELNVKPQEIVFLTDVVKEAEAAKLAGMQAVILNRPGNALLTDDDKINYTIVDDFDALKISVV